MNNPAEDNFFIAMMPQEPMFQDSFQKATSSWKNASNKWSFMQRWNHLNIWTLASITAIIVFAIGFWRVRQRRRKLQMMRRRPSLLNLPSTNMLHTLRPRSQTDSGVSGATNLSEPPSLRRFLSYYNPYSTTIARHRKWSHSTTTTRDYLGSTEIFRISQHTDHDEFLEESDPYHTLSPNVPALAGPAVQEIPYQSLVPPPRWSEASRSLFPQETHLTLEQQVFLTVAENPKFCTLRNERRGARESWSIADISVHSLPPAEGGVLEIYVKGTAKEEWMEHTFLSATKAAQFQMDVLALQWIGKPIYHMYQMFEIIHQGSIAYKGEEVVWHDETKHPDHYTTERSGIAWDDVMRCLGTHFPMIQSRLDAAWWATIAGTPELDATPRSSSESRVKSSAAVAGKDTAVLPRENTPSEYSLVDPQYENKRLLLGPVDFFRLFVPLLSETAIPLRASSQLRMEKMLRWRKRVARAAVLVRSYANAKRLANFGWRLDRPLPTANYLTRRLAYDDNTDNAIHDASARNEYYEASVSRDVICRVRCLNTIEKPSWTRGFELPSVCSSYQGYTLVGMHVFRFANEDEDFPLQFWKDPVLFIPSLRRLVEGNPELDFFVFAFFPEQMNVVSVIVYVRSLPKGIDEKFDRAIESYVGGSQDERDRRLELLVHFAMDNVTLSFLPWLAILWLSLLLRLTVRKNKVVSQPSSGLNDRTAIPALRLSSAGETYHFGGSLQVDETLPQNYVAANIHISSKRANNIVTCFLLSFLDQGGLSMNTLDFNFIIVGNNADELPERVLGNIRLTHVSLKRIALGSISEQASHIPMEGSHTERPQGKGLWSLYFRIFVSDPMVAVVSQMTKPPYTRAGRLPDLPDTSTSKQQDEGDLTIVSSSNPYDRIINEMIDILSDIQIPMRKKALQFYNLSSYVTSPIVSLEALTDGEQNPTEPGLEVVQVPLLKQLKRNDIYRYFVGSGCKVEASLARLVESYTWRGLTFPIDIRMCRLELHNGQFFQQGKDRRGDPVFYFRNMCLGPWRGDEDAVIAAVLHRFETQIRRLEVISSDVTCTLIALMGKPHKREHTFHVKVEDEAGSTALTQVGGDGSVSLPVEGESYDGGETVLTADTYGSVARNNPRIPPDEKWHPHTSKRLIQRLISVLLSHYPERLSKALVVVGHGNKKYARTAIHATFALPAYLASPRTRDKVKFLIRYRDLQKYVDRDELVTIAGGTAQINSAAFEAL